MSQQQRPPPPPPQQQQQPQEGVYPPGHYATSPNSDKRDNAFGNGPSTTGSSAFTGPPLPPPSAMHRQSYPTTHQVDYSARREPPYPPVSSRSFAPPSQPSWDYNERYMEQHPPPPPPPLGQVKYTLRRECVYIITLMPMFDQAGSPVRHHHSQQPQQPHPQHPQPPPPPFQPRDYARPSGGATTGTATGGPSLPLPHDMGTGTSSSSSNSAFQLPRPPMATSNAPPFDPIRSSAHSKPTEAVSSHHPHMSQEHGRLPPQAGYHFDRGPPTSTASPVMSISQLLSSDAPPRPPQQPSTAAPVRISPLSQSQTFERENQTVPEAKPSSQLEQQQQQQPSFRSNGIRNLLNNESEEAAQPMADSDTDTEDIPLISQGAAIATPTTKNHDRQMGSGLQSTMNGQQQHSHEYATQRPGEHVTNGIADSQVPQIRHRFELSDDSSGDELSDHEVPRMKSLTEKTLEELQITDDDDEEIFDTHRDEMVQYMIEVHRRRQRVIEDYENKRAHRHARISDHLQRIYEKRYGSEFVKQAASENESSTISATTAMLLQAAKEDKERLKRKNKRARLNSEDYDSDATDQLIYRKRDKMSARQIDDERQRIWLNIARKDIPRMARILSRVQATRAGNCKKIAQYCQKEAKRAAAKGNRSQKDIQLRSKRATKEMLAFWKKNEKEERELRKKAEKEALERLKQEEERREAQRQARKLNFLITQTELYSHFIGRKIKQDTSEDDETAVPTSEPPTPAAAASEPTVNIEDNDEDIDPTAGEQALEEIDFDDDDEAKLREHARRSAQNALAKQRERTRAFDEGARERRAAADSSDISMSAAQLDTMNFQDPSSMGTEEIKQPSMLMCQLKSYQLKGLNWLANLYEQGINGILADEMGLGKTVQSISLMAYLAEVHNIWGPFLVIAPSSTLHNWQQEVSKFVPSFRALPYWGNPKDRKVLRQFWNRKQLYGRDAPFHVVITSYQLVLTDVAYFQRVKWQYMVLDEAQAIKSSSSARWKQLLGFHCRNRLLLTGTPIQNSMQELWALLHFIMPTLFDSHEEFSEWFSKDIESHAENKGTLNEHQLRRLHMILKPFMLRRIKRNVQHELGEKIEVEIYCDLTARQRALYRGLKEKISISELLEKATSLNEESMDSLMNLVMQFRKVCNHPELFERADVVSPLSFCAYSESGALSKETSLYCPYSSRSHIKFHIPKHLYRDGGILQSPGERSNAGFSTRYLDNLMNIWNPDYIHESMFSDDSDSAFSFLRFVDTSAQEASYVFKQSLVARWIAHLAQRDNRSRRRFYANQDGESYDDAPINTFARFLITDTMSPTCRLSVTPNGPMDHLTNVRGYTEYLTSKFDNCYIPGARAVPVDAICDDRSFAYEQKDIMFDPSVRACLFGEPQYISSHERPEAMALSTVVRKSDGQGIMPVNSSGSGYSMMRVPAMRDLILDSGKLATLDRLLEKLKSEGHRCLVYFQMTRMIDLFEEYINYKQYKYLRLDGSSKISDRRDMVQDWQTRPEIFIFLLSTRAGGLGINLTAADTVIFYDSDWNPTVDQQAMDRAHRLGQTKQVTVYRLITKGTIEERILQRAKQKDEIQKVVISGGEFKQVDFKPREIVSLLLDDEEMDNNLQMQLKRKAEEEEKRKAARPSKRKKNNNNNGDAVKAMDRLMSAGGDTLPEDETPAAAGSSGGGNGNSKKKSRIGRPRTNISFTG
ncbi:snf2 family helicase atpase [Lichtheimia corymbifera JMRC:FSU:9682]|uniref:Chromatin-remodeling ATPase INO80 n=1 Tax=Lichtheimia corymbifera JMRC:FSU:9682 TaxID=1263082 RepID=A0A068RWF8_9FUNG|nr:snf2 family helicase atpase [Lichtheimia corymbifera JMRC:FSU:9682]